MVFSSGHKYYALGPPSAPPAPPARALSSNLLLQTEKTFPRKLIFLRRLN